MQPELKGDLDFDKQPEISRGEFEMPEKSFNLVQQTILDRNLTHTSVDSSKVVLKTEISRSTDSIPNAYNSNLDLMEIQKTNDAVTNHSLSLL